MDMDQIIPNNPDASWRNKSFNMQTIGPSQPSKKEKVQCLPKLSKEC